MSRPPFEVLEHTADVGLKVYGRTLPDLFANAARGLVSLALEPHSVEAKDRLALSARGSDLEELLVAWLSEILYYLDAEGWVFRDFQVRRLEGFAIEGEGLGQRRSPAELHWRVAVKAVTYHQISVRETPDGWEAVVYLDI